jgi:hypothetical protein
MSLREQLVRLKHDLGKYIAFQVRWLAADASATARREALTADLLGTRRGPEGVRDAPSVWAEFRPSLVGEAELPGGGRADLSDDITFQAIDADMTAIAALLPALADGTASSAAVDSGIEAALRVADAVRQLHRSTRG